MTLVTSTRLSQYVNAPRSTVYRALLDARAVAIWMVPDGMTSHVHAFEAREGGLFRVSLTYDTPTDAGVGTDVLGVHDNLPPGVAPIDNEKGWRMAFEKLARLVEASA